VNASGRDRVTAASPYKGLEHFTEDDAAIFFGRVRERDVVVANVTARRLTVLCGASGVGKSSLLRAGVVRTLRDVAERDFADEEVGRPEYVPAIVSSWTGDPARTIVDTLASAIAPFARASLPTVKELRPALRDLAAATPDLTKTFKDLNHLLNELAYNPPGETDEGYLFWFSWANHLAPTVFATQDAHGPIRHGLVVFGCQTGALLDSVAEANPQLGTLVDLLNGPNRSGGQCPSSSQEPGGTGG